MKRILALLVLFAGLQTAGAQESVSTHASVKAYLQTLVDKPVPLINAYVDRLIDSVGVQHPELQSTVAGIAFDFFTLSPVMGLDAVAVHIADDWFLNKRLELNDDDLYPFLYTYAEFNRSSLVGAPLPDLEAEDITGLRISVREADAAYKILFFYDTDCSTCRREAPLLAELLRNYRGEPVTVFAFYTQSRKEAWEDYVRETFSGIDSPDVTLVHLWDPEAESGFHKKYGVLSTPMLLLADSQNTIIGRQLDTEALARMLAIGNNEALEYKNLFDKVFGAFDPLTAGDVEGIIDAFGERTHDNPSLYAEVFTHLFNYLRTSDLFVKQQGALYLAEKYIAAEPDRWSSEFYERTVYALSRSRLNPLGSVATPLQLQNRCGRNRPLYGTRRQGTLIFFHLIDCAQCQQELARLRQLSAELYQAGIQVVLVYVGEEQQKWKDFVRQMRPSRWRFLNDFKHTSNMRMRYDLDFVPHLYLLDKNGVIIAKDIHASELNELLPLL